MDITEFINNNSKNLILNSSIPTNSQTEPCILGIDEAGRGPVLGPMVYGAAYCPISCSEKLKELGFADSKTLNEKQREELFEVIDKSSQEFLGWIVEIISPNTICNNMLQREKYSLNAISHDSAIGLIKKALASGVNVAEVYLDTVGPPDKYQKMLEEIFPQLSITVAKKADSTYPIVSAASICAKVTRDNALKNWKFQEGDQFDNLAYGSGYPNDSVTTDFLKENIDPVFGFPQLVRFSWSTAEKILEEHAAPVTWDEEDEETPTSGLVSILNFFKANGTTPSPKSKPGRKAKDHFFKERSLHHVSWF